MTLVVSLRKVCEKGYDKIALRHSEIAYHPSPAEEVFVLGYSKKYVQLGTKIHE